MLWTYQGLKKGGVGELCGGGGGGSRARRVLVAHGLIAGPEKSRGKTL